jgi:hypothetical protein
LKADGGAVSPDSNKKPLILQRPERKYKILHRDILAFPYFFWTFESSKIFYISFGKISSDRRGMNQEHRAFAQPKKLFIPGINFIMEKFLFRDGRSKLSTVCGRLRV